MKIVPCGHRLVVKPEKIEEKDEVFRAAKNLGIELPPTQKKQEQAAVDTGIVLAIGPNAFKDFGGEAWCKVGDKVAFAKYGGKFIDEYLVLNDEDIVAVLKDE